MTNIFANLFSVKNKEFHRVFTILGIKLKFKKKKSSDIEYEELANKLIKNLSWKIANDYLYKDTIPLTTLKKEAHIDTIDFIKNNIGLDSIILHENRDGNLLYSLSKVQTDGLFLEFGVYQGHTINLIANYFYNKNIYGFDSFDGLPEDWFGFDCDTEKFKVAKLPKVRENVKLIQGWFNDTLQDFLTQHQGNIAFLHIDCDIYSSTKFVLSSLKNRIKKGTIIVFDEYFNYPNWRNHEHKAFMEFIEETGLKFKYISVGYSQLTIKII